MYKAKVFLIADKGRGKVGPAPVLPLQATAMGTGLGTRLVKRGIAHLALIYWI